MENKVTSAGLAAMLALATGKQKELCEAFVTGLFAIVEEELAKGESVRIKGLGTFKLVEVEPRKSVNVATGENYEIPGHSKVVFVMSKELAAVVNAPFSAFEAVEIADALPTDGLDGDAEAPEYADSVDPAADDNQVDDAQVDDAPAEEDAPMAEAPEEIVETHDPEQDAEGDAAETENKDEAEDYEETTDDEDSFWKRYKFVIGFIAGVCASLLIGWMAISIADYVKPPKDMESVVEAADTVSATEIAEAILEDSLPAALDSVAAGSRGENAVGEAQDDVVPTKPSDAPVYDTVTRTRYLTTIAQEHYGNFNLWPIIYEENSKFLGHPDRIKPGTRVVVPPLSKYGVDPADKKQVNEVKEKGRAIYAKYK